MSTITTSYVRYANKKMGSWGYGTLYLRTYIKLDSQSNTNNTSTISIQSRIYNDGGSCYSGNCYNTVQGTKVKNNIRLDFPTDSEITLGTVTKTFTHDTDGTLDITATNSFKCYGLDNVTYTANATVTVPTIPRASKVACTSFNCGETGIITITRASDTFTHTLSYTIGSLSGNISFTDTETTVGFDTSSLKDSIYAQMPNAKSITGTITCTTYSGQTQIGTAQTCTFNIYAVEDECKPLVTATITDTDSNMVALTGDNTKIVKYLSKPQVSISATFRKSSAPRTSNPYAITVDGQTDLVQSKTYSDGVLSNNIVVQASDSRDYTTALLCTPTWIEYIKLALTDIQLSRTESTSTTLNVTGTGNYFNNTFGSVQNTLTLKYRYKQSGGTFGNYITISPTIISNTFAFSFSITNLDYRYQYEFEFVAEDEAMIYSSGTIIVQKGIAIIRIGDGYIDINGDVNINNNSLLDTIYPVGSIYMSVNNISPATFFGGTWSQIKDKFLLSAGDTYSAGSTGGESEHMLLESEMPSHSHAPSNLDGFLSYESGKVSRTKVATSTSGRYAFVGQDGASSADASGIGYAGGTNSKGSGTAHNNMPPYLTVYMWQRTA